MLGQGYRGSRYSFGYPACPKLEDQEQLLRLLKAAEIGVVLSDEYQLNPEQSTSAIVLHHPQAKYFSVGGSCAAGTIVMAAENSLLDLQDYRQEEDEALRAEPRAPMWWEEEGLVFPFGSPPQYGTWSEI